MRLPLSWLLMLQRQRIARGFELECKGYRAQAARVWATVDRLTRAVEARRAEQRRRVA